jgi:hypothetical protein
MTPPNKPEWIELADADSAPEVKKVTRALPALVLAAALSIVGVGALVAQSGADTPAIANEQGVSVSMNSSPTAPSATSAMASAISPSKSISVSNPSVAANPNAPQKPGIAAMPTGGDHDDDDDDHDRKDHDRGDHDDEEGDDD